MPAAGVLGDRPEQDDPLTIGHLAQVPRRFPSRGEERSRCTGRTPDGRSWTRGGEQAGRRRRPLGARRPGAPGGLARRLHRPPRRGGVARRAGAGRGERGRRRARRLRGPAAAAGRRPRGALGRTGGARPRRAHRRGAPGAPRGIRRRGLRGVETVGLADRVPPRPRPRRRRRLVAAPLRPPARGAGAHRPRRGRGRGGGGAPPRRGLARRRGRRRRPPRRRRRPRRPSPRLPASAARTAAPRRARSPQTGARGLPPPLPGGVDPGGRAGSRGGGLGSRPVVRPLRRAAAPALVAVLLAGCGGGGGPADNGEGSRQATQILKDTVAALRGAEAVHMYGSIPTSGATFGIDLRYNRSGNLMGTITIGGVTASVVVTGGHSYLKGRALFAKYAGDQVAAVIGDRWVAVPAGAGPGGDIVESLSTFTDFGKLADALSMPSGGAVTKGASTTVDGRAVVSLRDADSILYVATTGKPYPVEIKPDVGSQALHFDGWDVAVDVSAPRDVLDFSSLGGATGSSPTPSASP